MYYIPDRNAEGYGMNTGAVEKLKNEGVQLIVTVDNGISAINEIDYANSLGIDVVVTDHHKTQDILPKAVAVVKHGNARLGIVLQLFDTVVDRFVSVNIRERGDDKIVEPHGLFCGDKVAQLHSAVELVVLVHNEDRCYIIVFLSLTDKLVHRLRNGQVFADDYAVGGHFAAYLVLVEGSQQSDVALYLGRKLVDDERALFLADLMQDIGGCVSLELFGDSGSFFDVELVEIQSRFLFLEMLESLGKQRRRANPIQLFALGKRQRIHRKSGPRYFIPYIGQIQQEMVSC